MENLPAFYAKSPPRDHFQGVMQGMAIDYNEAMKTVRTPCIGVCSTTSLGDRICRGCKRSNVEVIQRGGLPPAITVWQAGNVPRDGRALPAALNALLDSRPDPTAPWSLFQVLDYNGPIEPVNTNNVWQILAGLAHAHARRTMNFATFQAAAEGWRSLGCSASRSAK